jgi:hypothetical protein
LSNFPQETSYFSAVQFFSYLLFVAKSYNLGQKFLSTPLNSWLKGYTFLPKYISPSFTLSAIPDKKTFYVFFSFLMHSNETIRKIGT